jgi:hypothetical protein
MSLCFPGEAREQAGVTAALAVRARVQLQQKMVTAELVEQQLREPRWVVLGPLELQ